MNDPYDPLANFDRQYNALLALRGLNDPSLRDDSQQLSSDDEQSLVRQLGGGALSGLGYVGATLAKPARILHAIPSGNPRELLNLIPFSDTLGLTDPEHQASGSTTLENFGILPENEKGFDAYDIPRFAADVALDPLTYFFGAGAAGKAAKIASGAGALGKVGEIATSAERAINPLAAAVGKRVAAGRTTLGELFAAAEPELKQALQTRATKLGAGALDDAANPLLQQKLGQSFGFGLPFTHDPLVSVNSEPLNALMDTAGSKLRWNPLTRQAARLLHAPAAGAETRAGQETGEAAYALRDKLHFGLAQKMAEQDQRLMQLGIGDSSILDQLYEVVKTPAQVAAETGVPEGSLTELLRGHRGVTDAAHELLTTSGVPVDFRENYLPREMSNTAGLSRRTKNTPIGPVREGSQPLGVFDPNSVRRNPLLDQIMGGKAAINQITRDPELRALIESGADIESLAGAVKSKYGPGGANPLLLDQYVHQRIPVAPTAEELAQGIQWKPDQLVLKDHSAGMAGFMASLPDTALSEGLFGNHPHADMWGMLDNAAKSSANARAIFGKLAEPGSLLPASQAARIEGSAALGDFLKSSGLTPSPSMVDGIVRAARANPDLAKTLATSPDAIFKLRVPSELATDLQRYTPNAVSSGSPISPLLDKAKQVTDITKAYLTSPWPAFHARNRVSGVVQNALNDIASPAAEGAVRSFLGKGGGGKYFAEMPYIQKMVAEAGLPLTEETATTAFQRLTRSLGFEGSAQGVGQGVGAGDGGVAKTLEDVASKYPGQNPFSAGKAAAMFAGRDPGVTLNPLDIAGFGGRETSKFGPVAAGSYVGGHIESLNRLAPLAHQLHEGIDPLVAARKVMQTQAEYSQRAFTPFERQWLTQAFPFYRFQKGMVKQVADELLSNPGGKLAQTIKAVNAGRGDDATLPDYIAGTTAIPIPEGMPFGPEAGGDPRYLTGFGLMHEDPLGLAGSPKEIGLEALSRLNPLIKGPLEYITGQSFFQKGPEGGRPLDEQDPLLGRLMANMTGQDKAVKLPAAIEQTLANSPISRLLSTARTLTDRRKDWPTVLSNIGTGVRFTDVTPAAQDAKLRELLMSAEKQLGARTFENTYFPKDALESMNPQERAAAVEQNLLMKLLADRAKARAKVKKKAG